MRDGRRHSRKRRKKKKLKKLATLWLLFALAGLACAVALPPFSGKSRQARPEQTALLQSPEYPEHTKERGESHPAFTRRETAADNERVGSIERTGSVRRVAERQQGAEGTGYASTGRRNGRTGGAFATADGGGAEGDTTPGRGGNRPSSAPGSHPGRPSDAPASAPGSRSRFAGGGTGNPAAPLIDEGTPSTAPDAAAGDIGAPEEAVVRQDDAPAGHQEDALALSPAPRHPGEAEAMVPDATDPFPQIPATAGPVPSGNGTAAPSPEPDDRITGGAAPWSDGGSLPLQPMPGIPAAGDDMPAAPGEPVIIGGNGPLPGPLVAGPDVIVSPGHSPGTLTVDGDFILEAGGLLEIQFAGTGAGLFDVLDIRGDAIFEAGGMIEFSFIDDYVPLIDDSFEFLLAQSIIGFNWGDPNWLTLSIVGLPTGLGFTIDQTRAADGRASLTFRVVSLPGQNATVPEPSTLLLMALGVAAAIRRRALHPEGTIETG